MAFEQINAKWKSLSTKQKVAIVGGALLLVGVANNGAGHNGGAGGRAFGAPAYAAGGSGYGGGYGATGGGNGGGGMQGYPAPSYAAAASYGAASPGGAGSGAETPDINADYEARERIQDQSARGFDQYIRDQTDVRDTQTGDIVTDVPNQVADPAIASGSYEVAPPAEVSAATESAE